MKRYQTIAARDALSTVAAALLLAACGGGGSGNSTSLDVSGIWAASASGANPQSFVYAVNGEAYGYQIDGTTIRFFKGATYSAKDNDFSYTNSRYDEGTVGSIVTTAAGRTGSLIGKYVPGNDQVTLSFAAAGATPTFKAMTATYDVVGKQTYDLRDFAGSYSAGLGTGNSVTLTAGSATSGTLAGTGINGCSFSGTIARPRSDRNVWTVALTQSACTDAKRNGLVSNGMATLGKSGTTLLLNVLSLDGQVWNRLETSR